jgi:TonB family protein
MPQPEAYGTPPSPNQKSWDKKSSNAVGEAFSAREVTDVFRTIAAHGGGAASFDLALDLVLNQVVEQARLATGATGAAIALARAGEMVCRATSGADAPELGVRLDMTSGLSGACLQTGTIQRCSDTETDPRVNAEDCRRLGVRSIVMLPLEVEGNREKGEGKERFGILQAFSSWPNAFSDRDVNTLQALARRVVDSVAQNTVVENRVAENRAVPNSAAATVVAAGASVSPKADDPALDIAQDPKSARDADRLWPVDARNGVAEESEGTGEVRSSAWTSVWTTILGLLVIVLAVVLGLAVGWRAGIGRALRGTHSTAATTEKTNQGDDAAAQRQPTPVVGVEVAPAGADGLASPATASTSGTTSAAAPPSGGLLVTQNGKVIYRLPSAEKLGGAGTRATAKASERVSATRLIHRVEPQYPAEASAKQIQGPVTLDVQIGTDGAVHNITVVEGDAMLAEAAVQAVRQWRYQPYVVNGRAVEMETRVTIRFTLPRG